MFYFVLEVCSLIVAVFFCSHKEIARPVDLAVSVRMSFTPILDAVKCKIIILGGGLCKMDKIIYCI